MPLSIANRPDEAQARAVIGAALEAGVNLIDSADCYCLNDGDYGHSERLISAVLRERGGEVLVSTKGGVVRPGGEWWADGRPEHLREACERSLRNLGVETIDLYYLHAPDPAVVFEDSVGELTRLREAGKIRHIGLSNVNAVHLERALAITPVAAVQNRCNLLDREDLRNQLVGFCARHGVGYVAYAPVGGHNGHQRLCECETLKAVADRHGCGVHGIALAWLLSRGEHLVAIPGASRPESIRASVAAATIELSGDDLAQLASIPEWV